MRVVQFVWLTGTLLIGCNEDAGPPPSEAQLLAQSKTVRPLRIPSVEEDFNPVVRPIQKDLVPSELPLPAFWQTTLASHDGKDDLESVMHRSRVSVRGPNTFREITVVWSKDYRDAEMQALSRHFKLPKPTKTRGQWTQWNNKMWRIRANEEDFATTTLDWRKTPPSTPEPQGRCGRPHHLETPFRLTKKLRPAFRKMSTKRTIEVQHDVNKEAHEISMTVWYKNGFAQDEHVGQIQSKLESLKWRRMVGSSVKQSWTSDGGLSINWYPIRESLPMGCTLRGPLIRFSWRQER